MLRNILSKFNLDAHLIFLDASLHEHRETA